jgi:hypothetical protein
MMFFVVLFFALSVADEVCKAPGGVPGSSVDARNGFLRVKNLAVLRDKLELVQPLNEYKPAGSKRDAFQVACETAPFFNEPLFKSYGLSSDNRPFGLHYLLPVPELPKCDVTIAATTVLFNRDWFRNIWHRVANDLVPAFRALRTFGLQEREDLHVAHLDWAQRSFEDLYNIVSPNATWLRDLPASQNVVCFSDVVFMVSRDWSVTFPDHGGPQATNPEVQEFSAWTLKRLGLFDVKTSFLETKRQIKLLWISRDTSIAGNRAFKNEETVIPELQGLLGPEVTIEKVRLESLSLREQIRIVRSADIVWAAHGAGLTHILWLHPHAVVAEALPYKFFYLFYEGVAGVCGIRYVKWQESDPQFMVDESWKPHTKFSNFVLRTSEIRPVLESALSKIRYT